MLPDGGIRADRIWKRFREDRRRSAWTDELSRTVDRLKGRPARPRWRWALRDIDFTAEPGDSIGLVGANGSGKSTLLKILTRVMYPYAGRLDVAGRVGALIEVSAGIHPQLTGRENTYLYGSLLGLKRKEVVDRFDEIVAFAEIDSAIDRQVKYYSSGMRMRLGFAVAAFLDPHILLVDEVLAVGDASFQQKCLDRMRDVMSQGTTLVLVSHDLAAVEATCTRGIWLHNGTVQMSGTASEALGAYRSAIEEAAEALPLRSGPITMQKVEVTGAGGGTPATQEPLEVTMVLQADQERGANVFLGVSEGPATPIFSLRKDLHLLAGETTVRCDIERLPLPRGRYYLWVAVVRSGDLIVWHPAARFDVSGATLDSAPRGVVRLAPVHVDARWEVEHR
jgi:ABC-type polysaccharide/polyol phosphate transport system ATPase subunit